MVWSLSQDDDGLDSVQSPGVPSAQGSSLSSSTMPSSSSPSSSAPFSSRGGAPQKGVPSDRPNANTASPASRRRTESTLVLGERRLDSLRAEVKRRHRRFALMKFGAIFGWMLAGGAAVGAGVFAAQMFSQPKVEAAAVAPVASGAPAVEVPTSSAALVRPQIAEKEPSVASALPSAEPSVGASPSASQEPSVPKVAPPATSSRTEAVSLDDLPSEKKPVRHKLKR